MNTGSKESVFAPFFHIIALTKNQITGTNRDGKRFSVLQSFRFNNDNPDAVIISPPTMSSSAMSALLMAELEISAMR